VADQAVVDALAAGVLGVAVFCVARLVLGAIWRRPAGRDVDVTHVLMGISMAGMLTGWLSGTWTVPWLASFGASTCWFAWRTRHELTGGAVAVALAGAGRADRAGSSGDGHVHHLVASAAMLYMLVAMRWLAPAAGAHGMAGMGGSSSLGAGGTPLLALVVAGLLLLDASILAAHAFRPRAAVVPAAGAGGTMPPSGGVRGLRPLAPRGGAACTMVMTLAMAYMFVTMHP
jgi:hypothetical protein